MKRIIIFLIIILFAGLSSPITPLLEKAFAQSESNGKPAQPAPIVPLIPPGTQPPGGTKAPDSTQAPGNPAAAGQNGKAAMQDIHDLKPNEPAGFDIRNLYYGLAALGLLLLILLGIYLWRKRKRRLQPPVVPPAPPEEIALADLDALSDFENMDGRQFYFHLSSTLRYYLFGRYQLNAPEMTTEELTPAMDRLALDRELKKRLKALFQSADPIKFAGKHTVLKNMEDDLMFSRRFVKETTPKAEEA